jgi:hypothetical protein
VFDGCDSVTSNRGGCYLMNHHVLCQCLFMNVFSEQILVD